MTDIVTVTNGKHKVVKHTFLQHGLIVSLGLRKKLAQSKFQDHAMMGNPKTKRVIDKFMVFGDRVHEIHTVVVHRFRMGDVEDPDLYAAQPLWEWQQSEMGVWVMERAVDTPEWHRQMDPIQYHTQYAVVAKLKDIDYTFWTLKWSNDVDNKLI